MRWPPTGSCGSRSGEPAVKLAVDGGGFLAARDAFEAGNQWAAMTHHGLADGLSGFGAMAGDSSLAGEFAAAYDEAARETLGGLGDLVVAFATCGRLTAASLTNHRRAEDRSVFMGPAVYEGGLPPDGYVAVLPVTPPSSLGGDLSGLPGWATWLLDQVEGFVWPDADIARLRAAAALWRTSASKVESLRDYADSAARHLAIEVSPEVASATSATDQLGAAATDLSSQMTAVAAACDTYADRVEQQRALILDLVSDTIRDAVIIQGIGIVLGAVTAGATAAGAAGINAAKIAATAPRLMHLVSEVRAAAAVGATSLRAVGSSLRGVRFGLHRFRDVRIGLAETRALRAERVTRMARLRASLLDPRRFTPMDLRGLSREEIADLCKAWTVREARSGDGLVYVDPFHRGRQIRVMEGYPGNRPDEMTHGLYAVISQGSGRPVKVPLDGNPLL